MRPTTMMCASRPALRAALLAVALTGLASPAARADERPERTLEFDRDIRPILSDHCFQCHGPDRAKRKAKLRLDQQAGALADLGGYRAIVAGDPDGSELYRRVTTDDDTERMPPPDSGRTLSAEQVRRLRLWIEQGATWQTHWSLRAPVRPQAPAVSDPRWPRGPLDAFILARLDRERLAPSPEAEKTTLIRRVTLDLTGLPPTPAEVDAYLADPSPRAYENVVDRLLASPRYGERMASRWLDAARYADTNGYQTDGERQMWRWRDWVIDAFNRNMPFDRFTVEQVAGDLLPGATLDQKIATGFNRNHRGNAEGGIIPEEYAVEYVVDRVDTTSTVWLGMTMLCARCHDHKYDPITQREFYQLFAFFNNVPEKGKAIKYGNSPPAIKTPTRDQQAHLDEVEQRLARAEACFSRMKPALESAQAAWEKSIASGPPIAWSITEGLLAHYPFDGGVGSPSRPDPQAQARMIGGPAAFGPGPLAQAIELDGTRHVDAGDVADFGFYDRFSLAAWIRPDDVRAGTILSRMTDAEKAEGYSLALVDGRIHLNLVKRWLDDAIRVRSKRALDPGRWHHVAVAYDGSRLAGGIALYIDGDRAELEVQLDDLNQSFQSRQPLRIGAGNGPAARFRGRIDDVRIYARSLSAEEAGLLATLDPIEAIAALAPSRRTDRQSARLAACFLETRAPAAIAAAHRRVAELRAERERLIEGFPTTMVMQEMDPPRPTFVLRRGEYDKAGEPVGPGVPACLPPLPSGVRRDRLALARWLVDPANPLTARVAVNRYWQMYFGTGLVKTVDDLGSQGERPRHPELLDWLATEFVRTGWNVKALQKTIVMSATYRQSARVDPERIRNDPENRLLARGPRLRLSAEMIRDQALAISGLLVEQVGGPSVRPYQPPGLWKELADADYVQGHGADLYRRSLYTFWKRTVSPPSMLTFDASARETCTVRETRTNTPLQALTLLNEVTFVEAARVLAQRLLTTGGNTPDARLVWAFRLATARPPHPSELAILRQGLEVQLGHYRQDPTAARELCRSGEFPVDETLDPCELAAYTAVANLILNLDETITKE